MPDATRPPCGRPFILRVNRFAEPGVDLEAESIEARPIWTSVPLQPAPARYVGGGAVGAGLSERGLGLPARSGLRAAARDGGGEPVVSACPNGYPFG